MKNKSDFFQDLRTKQSYAEKLTYMRTVTHSTRMAMLWLYVELDILPPENFRCKTEELMFLWQYMPNTTTVNPDNERITIMRKWITQIRFSAPIMEDNLVPGMSKILLAEMFKELLNVHLQTIEKSVA